MPEAASPSPVEALKSANAKRFPLPSRPTATMSWGEQVEDFKDALPGDILQFRDAEFKGKKYPTQVGVGSPGMSPIPTTRRSCRAPVQGQGLDHPAPERGPAGADDAEKQIVQQGTLRMDSLQKGDGSASTAPWNRPGYSIVLEWLGGVAEPRSCFAQRSQRSAAPSPSRPVMACPR